MIPVPTGFGLAMKVGGMGDRSVFSVWREDIFCWEPLNFDVRNLFLSFYLTNAVLLCSEKEECAVFIYIYIMISSYCLLSNA